MAAPAGEQRPAKRARAVAAAVRLRYPVHHPNEHLTAPLLELAGYERAVDGPDSATTINHRALVRVSAPLCPLQPVRLRFPVHHPSAHLTAPLLELAGNERAALTHAAGAIQALDAKITDISQLSDGAVPFLADGCLRKIASILERGTCGELDAHRANEPLPGRKGAGGGAARRRYTTVLGVGSATAQRWWEQVGDVPVAAVDPDAVGASQAQRLGLRFHEELRSGATPAMAAEIVAAVRAALGGDAGWQVTLVGSGRRTGDPHDVDLLATHPRAGAVSGALRRAVRRLVADGFVCGGPADAKRVHDALPRSPDERTVAAALPLELLPLAEHFRPWWGQPLERWGCFLRVQSGLNEDPELEWLRRDALAPARRGADNMDKLDRAFMVWRSLAVEGGALRERRVRVDLVVAPPEQHAFALMGWSASQQYNRHLRQFARDSGVLLTSHGAFSRATGERLGRDCRSEADVFELLGLSYVPPEDRHCAAGSVSGKSWAGAALGGAECQQPTPS